MEGDASDSQVRGGPASSPPSLRAGPGPTVPRLLLPLREGRAWGPTGGSGYGAPGHAVDSPRRALPWGSVRRSSRSGAPCALESRARAPSVPTPFVWSPEGRSSPSWTPAVPAARWEPSLRLAGRGRGPCGGAVPAFSLRRSGRRVP